MSCEYEFQVDVTLPGTDVIVSANVTVEVDGTYRPATWGYDGGDPPEYPEASVVSIDYTDEVTGETCRLPASVLTEKQVEEVEEKAVEQHSNKDDDGYDPSDF